MPKETQIATQTETQNPRSVAGVIIRGIAVFVGVYVLISLVSGALLQLYVQHRLQAFEIASIDAEIDTNPDSFAQTIETLTMLQNMIPILAVLVAAVAVLFARMRV